MNLTKTTEALEKFGKYVVQQSKSILTKQKKGGGSLYNSIKQDLDEEQNAFLLDFMMESYGEFVDKGVKGKNPNDNFFDDLYSDFRKTTQFLITRSIYLAGITPSMFFTKPFEKAFKNLPTEVINAFALDVEKSIVLGIKK